MEKESWLNILLSHVILILKLDRVMAISHSKEGNPIILQCRHIAHKSTKAELVSTTVTVIRLLRLVKGIA